MATEQNDFQELRSRVIQGSELSVVNFCSRVICFSRIFSKVKKSKMLCLPIHLNIRHPFFVPNTEGHSFVSRMIVAALSLVSTIISTGALPKVYTAIVESVLIPMVSLFTWATPENDSVHPAKTIVLGVKTFSQWRPHSVPIPLREPFKIRSIHHGILTLRKGNVSERLIERLNGNVSVHVSLHRSSFKGPLQFSRILSYG
jgi:hypothetical protein